MKRSKFLSGASNKNSNSQLTSKSDWFKQKHHNGLQYNQVYQVLDELTQKGYNCYQICQILELGEQAYKDGKIV